MHSKEPPKTRDDGDGEKSTTTARSRSRVASRIVDESLTLLWGPVRRAHPGVANGRAFDDAIISDCFVDSTMALLPPFSDLWNVIRPKHAV